jgi:hypothetical protein
MDLFLLSHLLQMGYIHLQITILLCDNKFDQDWLFDEGSHVRLVN